MAQYDGSIKFDTKLDTTKFKGSLSELGTVAKKGMAAVGAAVVAGLGAATKAGMDFEAQMSKVEAISGASAEAMAELTEKAKQMGIDTAFSATEAGEAMEYMAMAGWKTEDMLGGIEGIMNLAAASGENLGQVSDIVTDALTAFGLQAQDSSHFADVLAAASSNANTNVSMMGATFKYVAPVAGAMKFSIEDTAQAIGLMANAGIKGEQAGTTLRAVLTRLAKPPKEAAEAIDALGLSMTNADGSFKSFGDIIGQLREKFAKLTDEQKTQYAAMLGGQEAMSGLLAIVNAAPADFDKLSNAIKNADGTAQDMADTMLDNLQGQMTLTKSSLEGLGLAIYDGLADPLKEAAKSGISSINTLTNSIKNGGLTASIQKVGQLFANLIKTLVNLATTVIPPLVKALAFVGDHLNLVIAAITASVVALKEYSIISQIVGFFKSCTVALGAYTAAVAANTAAEASGATVSVLLASTLSAKQVIIGVLTGKIKLATAAQLAWKAVMDLTTGGITLLITAVAALAAGIVAFVAVTKSGGKEAEEQVKRNAESVTSFSKAIDDAKVEVTDYNKILSETGKTAQGVDQEIKKLEDKITNTLAAAIQSQKGIRDQDIRNIESYMEDIRRLQSEKLEIYRTQQVTVLRKMQAEGQTITQEGQAKLIKEAQTALEESNKVADQQYGNRVALIENKYRTIGQIGTASHMAELSEAKKYYNDDLTENQKYYSDVVKLAELNVGTIANTQKELWNNLAGFASQMSTTGKGKFAELFYTWQDWGGTFSGIKSQYQQQLANMDLDTANALMGMAATVRANGEPLNAETQMAVNNIVTSFANLPPSMDKAGKDALLGIISGMDTQIPALQGASEMSASEICKVLADTFGVELPQTENVFLGAIKRFPEIAKEKFWEIIENVKTWAINLKDNIVSGVQNAITGFAEWMNELPEKAGVALGSALRKVMDFIDGIKVWFAQLPSNLGIWLKQAWDNVVRWAANLITTAQTEIPKFVSAVLTKIKELPGKVYEVGKNLVEGLWNGIISMGDWIKQKIGGFVQGIKDGFTGKKGFDTHSPSKWSKQIGEWIVEGLAEGIEETSEESKKAFNKLFSELDIQKQAGIINDEQYYKKLEKLRDAHLKKGSKEWWDYTIKLIDYDKKQADEEFKIAQEKYKKGELSATQYFKKMLEIRNTYFAEGTENYKEFTRTIENESLAVVEAQKQQIIDAYAEVDKAKQGFEDKLKNYGSLTQTINFEFADGTSESFTQLADIGKDIETLEQYGNALGRIEEIGGKKAQGVFEVLRDMGVDEGLELSEMLLSTYEKSPNQFWAYLDNWERKQKAADEIADKIYKNDIERVTEGLIKPLEEVYGKLPENFFEAGRLSAEKFGEGWMEMFHRVASDITSAVQSASMSFAPQVALSAAGSAAVAGSQTNTYNTTYTFASSGEPVSQQIRAAHDADMMKRYRGL